MGKTDDLRAALDKYGADLARWPEGAAAAREARASDSEFAAAWKSMERLEGALEDALRVPAPSQDYKRHLAELVLTRARRERQRRYARLTLAVGGSWAAAAMVAGLVFGQVLTPTDSDVLAYAEMALGSSTAITGN